MNTKKKFEVPHVYVILFGLIVIFTVLSYIIPAGQYDMMDVIVNPATGKTRSVVNPDAFQIIANTPVTLMQLLTAIPRGLQESAQIIFFIFISGGSLAVLEETKAIPAGIGRLIKMLKGSSVLIIPILMIFFSLGGAVFGMAEETIPFVPIFVAICMAMGYDSMVGAAIVLCGAGAGFSGAFINPFTIQVAQGISQVELLSGMGFRIVLYICLVVLSIICVMHYAYKVKKNPKISLMYEIDKKRDDTVDLSSLPDFTIGRKLALIIFGLSMVLLVYGVIVWGWYMDEIAALFLGMSILVAIVCKLSFNQYANALSKGMADIAGGALVVGVARGILVVMTDGNILHTILHAAAMALSGLSSTVSALGMYVFQCLLNFIVPSGSGQASVSMPILAPLSDLVGVTRQTACVAFQLGDGISNIFTPTSGYFMAALALGKIPWQKWAKWILPLIGLEYLLGAIFIVAAHMMQLQ